MSRLLFETMDRLTPKLRRGQLAAVERDLVGRLRAMRGTPFHIVIDLEIAVCWSW